MTTHPKGRASILRKIKLPYCFSPLLQNISCPLPLSTLAAPLQFGISNCTKPAGNSSKDKCVVSERLRQLKTQSKIRVRWKLKTEIRSHVPQMGKTMMVSTCCEAKAWKRGFPPVLFCLCSLISSHTHLSRWTCSY